jgi:hypothetical protein
MQITHKLAIIWPSYGLFDMGAFVISPLPPVLLEPLQTAGPLRFADITPFHR